MTLPNKHETKPLIKSIIENSCLTELEFLSLIYRENKKIGFDYINIYNQYAFFIKKSSGERSTIKRRARKNIKSCLLTLMLFMSINVITDKNLTQIKEISEMIKGILNMENEELYKKLDELLEIMIKELF